MAAVVPVLGAEDVPPAVDVPLHPLAADAAERLAAYWPDQFGAMRRM